MQDSVLNPVRSITVRGEMIEIRELKWPDYTRAIKDLSNSLLKLIAQAQGGDKTVVLDSETIIETITAHEHLMTWVIAKSTNKDPAWVVDLTAREVLPLVKEILELNMSQEVISQGKTLAGEVGKVLGLKPKLPGPWTTSSAPATP